MSYRLMMPTLLHDSPRQDTVQLASWRPKGIAALRIAFGCVWAIDASFKWQPGFEGNFTSLLSKGLMGQPPFVASWISFWLHVVNMNPGLFAHFVAVGETCIALGLIFGALSNLTCVAGIILSFVIWSTAQGFGGPYGPGSTDIGVGIIYVLVFVGMFLSNAGLTCGLDRALTSRMGKWSWLACGSVQRSQQNSMIERYPIPPVYPRAFASEYSPVFEPERELEPALWGASSSHVPSGSRLYAVKGQRLSPMRESEWSW